MSHGVTARDFDEKAISSTIFVENDNLTSGINVIYLHKQLLGFGIFTISLLRWETAFVGVVTLRSRDGVMSIIFT